MYRLRRRRRRSRIRGWMGFARSFAALVVADGMFCHKSLYRWVMRYRSALAGSNGAVGRAVRARAGQRRPIRAALRHAIRWCRRPSLACREAGSSESAWPTQLVISARIMRPDSTAAVHSPRMVGNPCGTLLAVGAGDRGETVQQAVPPARCSRAVRSAGSLSPPPRPGRRRWWAHQRGQA